MASVWRLVSASLLRTITTRALRRRAHAGRRNYTLEAKELVESVTHALRRQAHVGVASGHTGLTRLVRLGTFRALRTIQMPEKSGRGPSSSDHRVEARERSSQRHTLSDRVVLVWLHRVDTWAARHLLRTPLASSARVGRVRTDCEGPEAVRLSHLYSTSTVTSAAILLLPDSFCTALRHAIGVEYRSTLRPTIAFYRNTLHSNTPVAIHQLVSTKLTGQKSLTYWAY